jgi:small-conductance mechanosensitive channel
MKRMRLEVAGTRCRLAGRSPTPGTHPSWCEMLPGLLLLLLTLLPFGAFVTSAPALAATATNATTATTGATGTLGASAATASAVVPGDAAASTDGAAVVVFNRTVVIYRSAFLGSTPQDRARRAQINLRELLARPGPLELTVRDEPQGKVLLLDGNFALIVTPDDADRLRGETLEAATERTVTALRRVVDETRESRDRGQLLRGLSIALAVSMLCLGLAWIVIRVQRRVRARATQLLSERAQALRVGDTPLLHSATLAKMAGRTITLASSVLLLLLAYEWLGHVLGQFPYTRPWGEQLNGYLLGIAAQIGGGILQALPELVVALIIFIIARAALGLIYPFLDRVREGQASLGWLDVDSERPTRTLLTVGVWLFAIVMAYPYLPGAESDAFKGMSVLIGLMITVGGSSLIGQGASGLILTYSRTLKVGEYVRVADHEGTVTEMGTFTTRIRTGLGEEVTLPNALVLGTATKNYSRAVHGRGYIIDTTVTIGYDTPWRLIEAMLIEAAVRTPGILQAPAPVVFQVGLQDFYVEYRVVCQAVPSEPRPRAQLLTMLHRNIQDVFNEHGVQIMSPHYIDDPAQPKVVPPEAFGAKPAHPATAPSREAPTLRG